MEPRINMGLHTILFCILIHEFGAAPSIQMNRRKAVDGLGLTITCTSDVAITTTVMFSTKPIVIKGSCLGSGTCGSNEPRYNLTQNRAQRTTTLTISSVDSSKDSGTWFCRQEGVGGSADLVITQFASVLDWSNITFTPSLSSLPSSVTPQDTVTVTVTTPCVTPAASITWRYQQGVSGSPTSSTSSSQGSCPSGQVQTVNTLSLPGNTASLYNRQISLTVSVEHDSFDPPTYTRSLTSSSVQFPVPVTAVTMQEITTDNQRVRQREGTSLTLTCVTSACFPASTVTWSGLPSETTLTTRQETTSGVLVKTVSSVTVRLSRSDQDRTLRCEAANINGQTSPRSNRAVLEVSCPALPPVNFYCSGHTKSSVSLRWEDRNLQEDNVTFLIEKRIDKNDKYTKVDSIQTSNPVTNVFGVNVNNLESSSLYYFRLLRQEASGNSEPVIATCFTASDIVTDSCTCEGVDSKLGMGIGIGVGIMLVIGVVIFGIFFLYWKRRSQGRKDTAEVKYRHTHENRSFDRASTSNVSSDAEGVQRNEYAELETRDIQPPSTYEKIKTYENT